MLQKTNDSIPLHSAVPRICLLLQQCLDGTDPGSPFPPASDHPPTFGVSHSSIHPPTFGVSHSAILSHRDQPTPFFESNSLLPINHELPDSSELFHRGGGRRQPPGQHTCAGLLHLPLSGLLFRPRRCGSGGRGPLFPRIGRREAQEHRASLENAKPTRRPRPLPGRAEGISR